MTAGHDETTLRCDRCGSRRVASVNAKCSDLCSIYVPETDREHEGYVLGDMGIGDGDSICFSWCLACGKIQDDEDAKFPFPPCQLEGATEP